MYQILSTERSKIIPILWLIRTIIFSNICLLYFQNLPILYCFSATIILCLGKHNGFLSGLSLSPPVLHGEATVFLRNCKPDHCHIQNFLVLSSYQDWHLMVQRDTSTLLWQGLCTWCTLLDVWLLQIITWQCLHSNLHSIIPFLAWPYPSSLKACPCYFLSSHLF